MANLFNSLMGSLGDSISGLLDSILYATVYKLLYYAEVGLCWLVKVVYSMFEVVAGISQVSYNGKQMFLINVFFSDDTISKVYWGMAIIGMALCFGFAIVAVIRKTFDIGDKVKSSYGAILTQLGKSILIMCSMTLIMSMILYSTNILMQQVTYIFNSSQVDSGEAHVTYDDTDYAAMARIFNTIGNYSLNSSYQNRYNINSCYNEIRSDLQYLSRRGIFDVYYNTKDANGNTVTTWQSALQTLAAASDPEKELPLDTYNESVTRALTSIMELLRTDASFAPLKSYDVKAQRSVSSVKMDALMFLMGTFEAAKNPEYNEEPAITDTLRAAYYDGDKDIYDLDTVSQDFDIGLGATNYILVGLNTILMLLNLCVIIFNCVARIYNMLFLYLIAPPVIAASPLDDGGKLKQWINAMVIQSLGVFGTVISMRLLILFLPIILSNKLVLMDNVVLDLLCKDMIIHAAITTIKKASDMLTGILSDNAGFASARAADNSRAGAGYATGAATTALGAATKVGKTGMGILSWGGRKATAPIRRALNGYRAYTAMKNSGMGGYGGGMGGYSGGYGGYGGGGANWMNQGGMGGYGGGAPGGGAPGGGGVSGGGAPSGGAPGGGAAGGGAAGGGIPKPPPFKQNIPKPPPMQNNIPKPPPMQNHIPKPPPMPGSSGGGASGGGASADGGDGGGPLSGRDSMTMPENLGSSELMGGGSASINDVDDSSFDSGRESTMSSMPENFGSSELMGGGSASINDVDDGSFDSGRESTMSSMPENLGSSELMGGGSASINDVNDSSFDSGRESTSSSMPGSFGGGSTTGSGNTGSTGSAPSGGSIPTPPPMQHNIPKPPPMPQNMNKK